MIIFIKCLNPNQNKPVHAYIFPLQILMVFTDGQTMSTDRPKLAPAQKAWAANGATTYAIGVGSGIQKSELTVIAGDAKRVEQPKNFNELSSTADKLIAQVCKNLGKFLFSFSRVHATL